MKQDCFQHIEGDQEVFQQSLGQVQNLVLQCWGQSYTGLQNRVGVFDDLRNLCLIKTRLQTLLKRKRVKLSLCDFVDN